MILSGFNFPRFIEESHEYVLISLFVGLGVHVFALISKTMCQVLKLFVYFF